MNSQRKIVVFGSIPFLNMIKTAFSAILSFMYIGLHAQPSEGNPEFIKTYIEWTENYSLSWSDFNGKPGIEAIGDAGTAVAIKAKPFMVKNKVHYDVYALFNKNKSWYRDQSSTLLAHEQLHFDIAELYARKARKKIKELAAAGETDLKVYNREVQKILNESNLVDQRYDVETLHGAMTNKQKEWREKVKAEILALEKYKNQRVDIPG